VLERAVGHALGPYQLDAADVQGRAAYTNHPPNGAMRGFGVGQVAFALEQLVDRLAERVGLDGYQMRERNLLRDGGLFGPGQVMRHTAGLRRTLEAVREQYYGAPVAGIACGLKNVGLGNGKVDRGRVRLEVLAGGRLRLLHGMTEMGQGLHSVAAQLLCEGSGLDTSVTGLDVEACTDAELDVGMTTASRGTVLIGRATLDAAAKLRSELAQTGGRIEPLVGRCYEGEFTCDWTHALGSGAAEPVLHLSFAFATHVVTLDEATGRITRIVAAHDVGRAINPMLVEGQLEGSVHMGLGVALREELPFDGGRPAQQIRKLGVLRAHETPPIEIILVEEPEPHGPLGARGVGEMGLVPVAPAVASALRRFDGRARTALPIRDHYEAFSKS
jgi:xanthine dehydrogenase molybdenum-binding subunit